MVTIVDLIIAKLELDSRICDEAIKECRNSNTEPPEEGIRHIDYLRGKEEGLNYAVYLLKSFRFLLDKTP